MCVLKQSFHSFVKHIHTFGLCNIAKASPTKKKFITFNRMKFLSIRKHITKLTRNYPKFQRKKQISQIGCLAKKHWMIVERGRERSENIICTIKEQQIHTHSHTYVYTELKLFHSIWISLIKEAEERKKSTPVVCMLCMYASVCGCVSVQMIVSALWMFLYAYGCNGCQKAVRCCCRRRMG